MSKIVQVYVQKSFNLGNPDENHVASNSNYKTLSI